MEFVVLDKVDVHATPGRLGALLSAVLVWVWVLVLGSVLMLEFKEADNEDMEKELDVELRVCSCNKPNTFNNVSK